MNEKNAVKGNSTAPKSTSKKKKRKKKKTIWSIIKVIIVFTILMGIIVGGLGLYWAYNVLQDIEPIDPSNISDSLVENSVIYDSNGQVLELVQSDGLRTIVTYDEISQSAINAFVAVEDKTFWEHGGLNYIRLVGATLESLTGGGKIQGTSTITQQLARNVYLYEIRSERSLDRKLKEMYYALQLERYLTKEQILEAYLNTIYLGAGANGIEAAAQTYFSKPASELNDVEALLLAGIPSSPARYAPMYTKKKEDVQPTDYVIDESDEYYTIVYNPSCEYRFNIALKLYYDNGYITKDEYEEYKELDLKTVLNPSKTSGSEISSYFSDMVKEDVIKDLMAQYGYTYEEASSILYTSGLHIYSTIDFDMQKTLENAYSGEEMTPYFGESTHTAIKTFQKQNGLSADGVVGPGTIDKMAELGLVNASDFSLQYYKKGMEHEDVILLKKAMDQLGLLQNYENFPKVTVHFDSNGNIISKETSQLLLYDYNNLVNGNDQLTIPANDYHYDNNGNLILHKGKRLNFYTHSSGDQITNIQVVVKNSFTYDKDNPANTRNSNGSYNIVDLYTHEGKDVFIPAEYKSFDENKNLFVSNDFMAANPDFFKVDGQGNLLIDEENYVISGKGVIQPQSAMVIIDYTTGHLKAIVGGRNVTGQKIYNRAINPRQPGSSIKPIGPYLAAIDSREYTAASVIDDVPTYLGPDSNVRWPLNWYEHSSSYNKYWGMQTLRRGIEYSGNVVTVKLADEVGVNVVIDYLKALGITTIVEEGAYNDVNLSSVALGGMTKGVSPLEMTAAYGAIANGGVLVETTTYTHVMDSAGNTILENTPQKTKVVDPEVAFIVSDMMKSGVTSGLSTAAQISSGNKDIPVAGKTGTTSDKMDAWFVGYTPYYVSGAWFGNDISMPLDQGSKVSAKFWSQVMTEIHTDLAPAQFEIPANIVTAPVDTMSGKKPTELSYADPRGTVRNEYFVKGTEPREPDDVHVLGTVCIESNLLATENCPITLQEDRVFVQREVPYIPEEHLDRSGNPILLSDQAYQLPVESCEIHSGEYIDILDYENTGSKKVYRFPDGKLVVGQPFYIELTNGTTLLLPVKTEILPDGTVILPDGSVLMPHEIKTMPDFSDDTPPERDTTDPSDNIDILIDEIDNFNESDE